MSAAKLEATLCLDFYVVCDLDFKQIEISVSFTLGFFNLGSWPGCVGQGREEDRERESGSELVMGDGRNGVRRGVMECSGLERQAN